MAKAKHGFLNSLDNKCKRQTQGSAAKANGRPPMRPSNAQNRPFPAKLTPPNHPAQRPMTAAPVFSKPKAAQPIKEETISLSEFNDLLDVLEQTQAELAKTKQELAKLKGQLSPAQNQIARPKPMGTNIATNL